MKGKRKKIKIFLGAYLNQTNAQNLSCRALAQFLDKSKFEIYSLNLDRGNLPPFEHNDVHTFNCRYPVKITGVIGFIWGFYHTDIVYLPRGIFLYWQKVLLVIFKNKSFKTVRNVIDSEALISAVSQIVKPTKGDLKMGYNFVDRVYSMTSFMSTYNRKRWGIISEETTLIPPSEIQAFKERARIRVYLKEILFIGNDWERKGLADYLGLANLFPELVFHVVGQGNRDTYKLLSSNNVQYHGLLTGNKLIELMVQSDLHILPSRSEGLPRVLIETMANGLPSVLYRGYGAEEYVENGVCGFVLDGLSSAKSLLHKLLQNKISLKELSEKCITSSEQFDPRELTKNYERVIEELYAS